MTNYTAQTIHAYDNHAAERDNAGLDPRKDEHLQSTIKLFKAEGVRSILEVGSGPGHTARVFADAGFDIECTDISPRMIDLVREKGLTGHVLDCRELGSLNRQYDAAFSVNALLHIPSAQIGEVLRSVRSVLREGGPFVLGLWGGDDSEGIWEEDRYDPKRYFVLYSQKKLLAVLTEVFCIDSYRRVDLETETFFHTAVLRRRSPDQ